MVRYWGCWLRCDTSFVIPLITVSLWYDIYRFIPSRPDLPYGQKFSLIYSPTQTISLFGGFFNNRGFDVGGLQLNWLRLPDCWGKVTEMTSETPKVKEYFVLSSPLTMIALKSAVIGESANKSVEVNVRIKRPWGLFDSETLLNLFRGDGRQWTQDGAQHAGSSRALHERCFPQRILDQRVQ